ALYAFCFQAEDGIRVDLVTGVQTCALPICPYLLTTRRSRKSRRLEVRAAQLAGTRPPSGSSPGAGRLFRTPPHYPRPVPQHRRPALCRAYATQCQNSSHQAGCCRVPAALAGYQVLLEPRGGESAVRTTLRSLRQKLFHFHRRTTEEAPALLGVS